MICAHCGHRMLGLAGLNDDLLCHPDEGMDCYWLATVDHHPLPCRTCHELRRVAQERGETVFDDGRSMPIAQVFDGPAQFEAWLRAHGVD